MWSSIPTHMMTRSPSLTLDSTVISGLFHPIFLLLKVSPVLPILLTDSGGIGYPDLPGKHRVN
jgi:hypothetical protein